MFYHPAQGHGLRHNPFKAIVAPRPIAWVSTRASAGDNLAPYSFFNAITDAPPQVMFAGGMKDSITNAQESGVFAVNVVEAAMFEVMSATSAPLPRGTDEFTHAGVPKAECHSINCPRVGSAPATLECQVLQIIPLKGGDYMVIGEVTGVHLRDDCVVAGRFDITRFHPMARLGYMDYARIETLITLPRPGE
ncbi:MAG: flavin reductase family protein [Rhodobacteraceae bacterium]|jgi:flavin reductase (DIM6/NTAB) family NADH-FMN oxidoreductase RutF|nr:flavin reductase family protein [Paracoccaceae bacterium]